ncbi:MAG TPA: hydantoinase B/oxoprolinase family protein [Verrucomicrobiales bacterium]|nr:hydantoinase B/oxoprolinase family protein [Verrucomicrobiales bacterium]
MAPRKDSRWRVFADTGGTFTDCLGIDPAGCEHWVKVLSTGDFRLEVLEAARDRRVRVRWPFPARISFLVGAGIAGSASGPAGRVTGQREVGAALELEWEGGPSTVDGDVVQIFSGKEAPLVGCHLLTATPLEAALPDLELRLATTRATNALLEGKTAKVLLLVTRGFQDLMRIGDQTRPDLFALHPSRPEPLHARVIEVGGRLDAAGHELEALDWESLSEDLAAMETEEGSGEELGRDWSAAVSLLHSDRNGSHETSVADRLRATGWRRVSIASELCPFVRYLHRSETTLVNASLEPVMDHYLSRIEEGLGQGMLTLMSSSGGLLPRASYRAKDSLLSGPAGGVMGAVAAGQSLGWTRILALDMGGTSTDVSRYDGGFDFRFDQRVGNARLLAPALRIETVASGGGSVCGYDQGKLTVGPDSAGANPGPACYGLGGPLTLTDVHLLLGRIDVTKFSLPLSISASERAFARFLNEHELSGQDREDFLEGFLQIADERMAGAIQCVSAREGLDPAEFGLVVFGGAAGLHGCSVARLLGIRRILAPLEAGVLSARGLERAPVEQFAERQILREIRPGERLAEEWEGLKAEACGGLRQAGAEAEGARLEGMAELRVAGQESALTVRWAEAVDLVRDFREIYAQQFGYDPEGRAIELVSLRLRAAVYPDSRPPEVFRECSKPDWEPSDFLETWRHGERRRTPVYWRDERLYDGARVQGPALFFDAHSSFFLEPGWMAKIGERGSLLAAPQGDADGGERSKTTWSLASYHKQDKVSAELFTQRFRNGVSLMGEQLRRTALSTNVRERLDFSCCLLDRKGRLVANAPHIPVHLGAMGLCVREVARAVKLAPGDVVATNHPGFGGSHLPDITVVTPVFGEDGGTLLGYVANRAHHAEIGGIRPGSMAPDARSLEEEGVVISPVKLFDGGIACFERMGDLLRGGRFPSRNPEENLADLEAQAAANRVGEKLLREWCSAFGCEEVERRMDDLRSLAAQAAGRVAKSLPDRTASVQEHLDDGTVIRVRVSRAGGKLDLDFGGTDPRHPGNLNATAAIVRSAVIYVLRLLSQRDLPLNEGLMEAVNLRLPRCFLNPGFAGPPASCPAVSGGNVETSQRLVEALLRPFGVLAGSQGTMNNVVFGGEGFSYYETVGGGTGAGPGFDGCSGVHSHMTNTAITDPEILERRYPVRLQRFALRRGSGGAGRWRGGEGLVREMTFLEPATLSLLTQHRKDGPPGGDGGEAGMAGAQWIMRPDGSRVDLGPLVVWEAQRGDSLILETPGGGGWGAPDSE